MVFERCVNPLESLQSGYTCGTTVTLTCPDSTKLVIIEVTYSSDCPTATDEDDGGAVYAPSRCIGYHGERTSVLCNGKQTCTIDNSIEQRPSFLTGKQANCAFKGQSINVDYSCIPGRLETSWMLERRRGRSYFRLLFQSITSYWHLLVAIASRSQGRLHPYAELSRRVSQ